jgi:DNA-binding NtrC family response regulator
MIHYPKTVLHVDDDQDILALVARQLEKSGYQVISLIDPRRTLAELNRSGARVVLLDIDMPHIDGLTLLREIKRRDAGIQVTMCTGMVSISTVLTSTSLGAEGLIFKPLRDLDKVTDAVSMSFQKISRWWETLAEWKALNQESTRGTERLVSQSIRG